MSNFAGRDALMAPSKRRFREVQLPVKGVTVRVRSLMEDEYASFSAKVMRLAKGKNGEQEVVRARRLLIVQCLVDGDGNRIFGDHEADLLKTWDTADTGELQDAINKHLQLSDGDLDNLTKNSGAIIDAASQ